MEWRDLSEKEKKSVVAYQESAMTTITKSVDEGWIWHSVKVEKKGKGDISRDKPKKIVKLLRDQPLIGIFN